MESIRTWQCVDSHTEGMPTRVVVGGIGVLPGSTMEERRRYIIEQADDLTRLWIEPNFFAAFAQRCFGRSLSRLCPSAWQRILTCMSA